MRALPSSILGLVLVLAFSGCLQQTGDGGSDPPQTGTWSASSEYGVRPFDVTLHERIEPGTSKTWAFRVENIAPSDNRVDYNAACAGPFLVTLFDGDGRELQYEEPRVDCQEVDMKTLQAGDSLDHTWAWDGMLWRDGTESAAPEGIYTVRVGFEGFHAGNPEHVTDGAVGETTVLVAASG